MGQSFHAYPNVAQAIDQPPNPYSRATPLACDTLEFDTITATGAGYFDTASHCYVANVAQIMRFTAHLLWQTPRHGGIMNAWFMKNVLPPPDGSIGGEMCGCDVQVYQPSPYPPNNQSCSIERLMKLNPGDRVWCVPGLAGGGQLTNAIAGNSNNTVNYFEGELLQLL